MIQAMLMRRTRSIEQTTIMNMLGRRLMGMLDPTQDKVRRRQKKMGAVEDEAAMWRLRFRAHLDGMGLGHTLDHAVTPVPVKGDQRDLISRYGE